MSTWIGDETNGGLASMSATAENEQCGDCDLVERVATSDSMVVFYTYFIGFQARVDGFGDCNVDMSDGHNLCTDGAAWIRDNWEVLVNMYGQYAKRVAAVSPNKPVIWWLEGDFIQYSYEDQSEPLSYAELGQLAAEIGCAIKANQPNAVVAMNHSPWIGDDMFEGFWGAMDMNVLDMAWVQGPGDSGTYVNEWGQETANYASLYQKIGRPIMAETSWGSDDRWTTASVADINARISEGVIATHINHPNGNLESAKETLTPELEGTCH